MSRRSNVERLKARAANLRKIAERSKTKISRHLAQRMAVDTEEAATKAESEQGSKQLQRRQKDIARLAA